MRIEGVDLHQTAVYWEVVKYDRHGHVKVKAPVELNPEDGNGVRWINRRSQVTAPDGQVITLDARIVTSQEIKVNSIIWLGTLDEWNESGSDGNDTQLHQVKIYSEVPDIRNRDYRYEVGAQRWKKALPDIVA